jgi:hypothetical protein
VVRQGADVRPADQTDDRPTLSTGADPFDVESDGAFADHDGSRRFRQNASPSMATPEGDEVALSPAPSGESSDRLRPGGATALRAHAEGGQRPEARRGDGTPWR